MKELMDLIRSKKPSKIDPMEKEAKMGVLQEIKKLASDDMAEEIKGLKKVTVAAPDAEGLKVGLNKAEEMVEASCGMCGKEPCACGDKNNDEVMSDEEIDSLIETLKAKRQKASV